MINDSILGAHFKLEMLNLRHKYSIFVQSCFLGKYFVCFISDVHVCERRTT